MKILIAYATKHKTTEECAALLADCFKHQTAELLRIGKGGEQMPDISEYDAIIFGSNIRMTKIDKYLCEYLRKNEATLKDKRCGYFLCCGFTDCFEEYLEKNIPPSLIEKAIVCACFGGRLDSSRAKGMDKFVIAAVRSEILGGGENGQNRDDISLPTIMENNISQFADAILGK